MNVKIWCIDRFDSGKLSTSTFGVLRLACLLLYACLTVTEGKLRIVNPRGSRACTLAAVRALRLLGSLSGSPSSSVSVFGGPESAWPASDTIS